MPQDKAKVQEQVKSLGEFNKFGTRKEIKHLREVLDADEKILGMTSGFYDGNTWLVTVTDKRLLFLDKGMIYGLKQVDIHFDQVSAVAHKTGLLLGEIMVTTGGGLVKVEKISKQDVPRVATLIKDRIAALREAGRPSAAAPAGDDDVVSKLERLAKLRDSGVLTEEEFQQQKQALLNA